MGVVNNKSGRKKTRKRSTAEAWKLIFTRIFPFINILLEVFTIYRPREEEIITVSSRERMGDVGSGN